MRLAALGASDEEAAKKGTAVETNARNSMTLKGERDRPQPYSDANVDIPRTMDDVQPYYIFDSKTIEQSGAANLEELLRQRLPMNASGASSAQAPADGGSYGNASKINLRGLCTDQTLVSVNGRRQAVLSPDWDQPDINAVPPAAVERIEVLPSSASAIYGGSAIGGIVNIVLKKQYSGGEIRLQKVAPKCMKSPCAHPEICRDCLQGLPD